MIDRVHTILFVSDQDAAREFYQQVLQMKPTLDVVGMTEFELVRGHVLGLMPQAGAARILGEQSRGPGYTGELYLLVDDPAAYHQRALALGAIELSQLQDRDWGDKAAYSRTPDGHVLAFASALAAS